MGRLAYPPHLQSPGSNEDGPSGVRSATWAKNGCILVSIPSRIAVAGRQASRTKSQVDLATEVNRV